MPDPRQLTTFETADFLSRHPEEAYQIGKTKLAIEAGVYDWTQKAPDWFFAMVPPWGMQVIDVLYGVVTVFFGTDGTLYLTAYTQPLADISKPAYVPPPATCKDGSDAVFGVCPEDFNFMYLVGAGVLVYVGYQMFFAKTRA